MYDWRLTWTGEWGLQWMVRWSVVARNAVLTVDACCVVLWENKNHRMYLQKQSVFPNPVSMYLMPTNVICTYVAHKCHKCIGRFWATANAAVLRLRYNCVFVHLSPPGIRDTLHRPCILPACWDWFSAGRYLDHSSTLMSVCGSYMLKTHTQHTYVTI